MKYAQFNASVTRSFSTPSRFYDMELPEHLNPEALKTISLDTANQSQIVKFNVSQAVHTYKAHPTDTGSTSVQSKLLELSF